MVGQTFPQDSNQYQSKYSKMIRKTREIHQCSLEHLATFIIIYQPSPSQEIEQPKKMRGYGETKSFVSTYYSTLLQFLTFLSSPFRYLCKII